MRSVAVAVLLVGSAICSLVGCEDSLLPGYDGPRRSAQQGNTSGGSANPSRSPDAGVANQGGAQNPNGSPWGAPPSGTDDSATPPVAGTTTTNGAQCSYTPRELALPGEACARTCRETWGRCFDACAGRERSCVAPCDDTFRDCARGCY